MGGLLKTWLLKGGLGRGLLKSWLLSRVGGSRQSGMSALKPDIIKIQALLSLSIQSFG